MQVFTDNPKLEHCGKQESAAREAVLSAQEEAQRIPRMMQLRVLMHRCGDCSPELWAAETLRQCERRLS